MCHVCTHTTRGRCGSGQGQHACCAHAPPATISTGAAPHFLGLFFAYVAMSCSPTMKTELFSSIP